MRLSTLKILWKIILGIVLSISITLVLTLDNGAIINEISEDTEDLKENEKVADDFESRRANFNRVCSKYSDPFKPESRALQDESLARIYDYNYFWFNKSYTMVCSIHKVGSNSMHAFLNKILEDYINEDPERYYNGLDLPSSREGHEDESDNDAKSMIPVTTKCWPDCAKNHTKVLLVRHPLERLLSAYKYIFENEGKFHFNKMTWVEFVENIINYDKNNQDWKEYQRSIGDHWEPFWRVCQVCAENFRPKYILRLESLEADLRSYLKDIGLEKFSDKFPWVNHHQGHTSIWIKMYYSKLTKDQIRQLYDAYKLDHELFGYDPQPYIDFGK